MRDRLLWLPDKARSMGIHILAGKGSGKSRLMGRLIAWMDFIRGVPLVVFDPTGPSIDNFLDKLTRLPQAYQEQLWRRVEYVDMSGRGKRVVPFPLLYRLGDESLYTVSQRYLDVVRKVDPHLATASVQGWNALWRIGTPVGMVLAALGYQITEAIDLLNNPQAWGERFSRAVHQYPEVAPAVSFLNTQYGHWKEDTKSARTEAFLSKVGVFSFDPSLRAMFGAQKPGISWDQVVRQHKAVLLDFRHVHDVEMRRFKMLWVFSYLLEYLKHRGAGHQHRPISLIVDELSALTNFQAVDAPSLFAADLDELINVYARNYMLWLTLAHQELFQVGEKTAKTLLTMGTQIFGATADIDAAISVGRHFFPLEPYRVKRYEPVFGSYEGVHEVIHDTPVEFSMEEQQYMNAYKIKNQGAFHFLVRLAVSEGDVRGTVRPVTLKNFDSDMWVNEELVEQARHLLSRRRGVPIADVLADIQARLSRPLQAALPVENATMIEYAQANRFYEDDDEEILRDKK